MHRILGSITSFSHVHKNRSIASVYYPLDAVLTVNTGPLVNSVATSRTMPSHGGKPVVHADWWEMLRSNYSSLIPQEGPQSPPRWLQTRSRRGRFYTPGIRNHIGRLDPSDTSSECTRRRSLKRPCQERIGCRPSVHHPAAATRFLSKSSAWNYYRLRASTTTDSDQRNP